MNSSWLKSKVQGQISKVKDRPTFFIGLEILSPLTLEFH